VGNSLQPCPRRPSTPLLVVFVAAALTPVLARWLKGVPVPAVVLEIGAGVIIGPEVLGLAGQDAVTEDLANFGLSMLIFLAGYEVDPGRIRGRPLRLAAGGCSYRSPRVWGSASCWPGQETCLPWWWGWR
jgi:Kef-type K+ transport system membrane component KefB